MKKITLFIIAGAFCLVSQGICCYENRSTAKTYAKKYDKHHHQNHHSRRNLTSAAQTETPLHGGDGLVF